MWLISKHLINYDYIENNILYCTVFEITLSCNLKCMHCWSYAWKKRLDELSLPEIYKLLDDLKYLNCIQITLMWWEFWLRKDWFKIAEYIKQKWFELVIISNWFNLPNNVIEQIIYLQPYTIWFSIDWDEEIHDKIRWVKWSFKQVKKAIEVFTENSISIWFITTVNKLNIYKLPIIKEILNNYAYKFFDKNKSWLRWQIQSAAYWANLSKDFLIDDNDYSYLCKFIDNCIKDNSYNEDIFMIAWADDIWYYSTILDKNICIDKNWKWCKAWINVIWIQSNWNVLWCLSLPDSFIEGNIRDRSIIEIWNDENSFKYSRKFNINDLWENCKWCEHWEICKWWCTDVSFNRTWISHNSPFCLYRKEKNQLN